MQGQVLALLRVQGHQPVGPQAGAKGCVAAGCMRISGSPQEHTAWSSVGLGLKVLALVELKVKCFHDYIQQREEERS